MGKHVNAKLFIVGYFLIKPTKLNEVMKMKKGRGVLHQGKGCTSQRSTALRLIPRRV